MLEPLGVNHPRMVGAALPLAITVRVRVALLTVTVLGALGAVLHAGIQFRPCRATDGEK